MVIWNWDGSYDCLSIWIYSTFFNSSLNNSSVAISMKNYALKWLLQRLTASMLIPLTFWFIYSAISLSKMEYEETIKFFQSYFNSFLFFIMMQSMLLHSKLGLQTIIEDYVTSKKTAKFIKVLINYLVYFIMVLITVNLARMVF